MCLIHIFAVSIWFVLVAVSNVQAAQKLTIASAVGYRALVGYLADAYTKKTGIPVQKIYGNMEQLIDQINKNGDIQFLVGDKHHLDSADLRSIKEIPIGRGKLVLVVSPGTDIHTVTDFGRSNVKCIAVLNGEMASYGRAAREYLSRTGLSDKVESKLMSVDTIPQLLAAIFTGKADAGFIDMSKALILKKSTVRLLPVNENLYSPIIIVVEQLHTTENQNAAQLFVNFLQSKPAKIIIRRYGM